MHIANPRGPTQCYFFIDLCIPLFFCTVGHVYNNIVLPLWNKCQAELGNSWLRGIFEPIFVRLWHDHLQPVCSSKLIENPGYQFLPGYVLSITILKPQQNKRTSKKSNSAPLPVFCLAIFTSFYPLRDKSHPATLIILLICTLQEN